MGLKNLLTITPKSQRNYKAAVVAGLVSGVPSTIIKFGREVPSLPRIPERNATNPSQEFLEQLGTSPKASHTMVTFSSNELPICSFAIHFPFAVPFTLAHCLIAEKYPEAELWQGATRGLALWVLFHVTPMSAMGTVPTPWDQPLGEYFSEVLGHVMRMWTIEIMRRDLRNRIIHMPDPEVSLDTEPTRNVKVSG